jgi:hypothetical protein
MATESLPNTELSILSRIIDPDEASLSPEAARSILSLDFAEQDHQRMAELTTRNQSGSLSDDERAELESYSNVSHLLALWQSKARVSLKRDRHLG